MNFLLYYFRTETEEESEYDDTGLPGEFSNLKEDVVIADDAEQRKLEEQQAIWTTQPTMRSEPISKVFIEQRGEGCGIVSFRSIV